MLECMLNDKGKYSHLVQLKYCKTVQHINFAQTSDQKCEIYSTASYINTRHFEASRPIVCSLTIKQSAVFVYAVLIVHNTPMQYLNILLK